MIRAKKVLVGLLFLFLFSMVSGADEKIKISPGGLSAAIKALTEVKTHSCKVVEARFFVSNRIHVKCEAPAQGSIYYFALPVGDSSTGDTDALLSMNMILAAQNSGRVLNIDYVMLTMGDQFGCLQNDCRLIKSLAISK